MSIKTLAAISVLFSLTACDTTKIISSDYDYSYLSATETFASTRRQIGELYIFNPNSDTLEFTDNLINYQQADLRNSVPANLETSKVSGASVTLNIPDAATVSGSASFEAKVDADSFVLKSISRSDVSDKIERLYANIRKNDPESSELPLQARRVSNQRLLYVVVSGAGTADRLLISHGTQEGKSSGATITVNGHQYVDVTVDKKNIFDCGKAGEERPQCTADITVYSAKLVKRGDRTLFDVKPESIAKSKLTTALRNTFSR